MSFEVWIFLPLRYRQQAVVAGQYDCQEDSLELHPLPTAELISQLSTSR